MKTKIRLLRTANKTETNSCNFTEAEIKLILQGLFYAYTKDSITERKERYKKIREKIWRTVFVRK